MIHLERLSLKPLGGLSALTAGLHSPSVFAQAAATEAPGVSSAATLQMLLSLALVIGLLFLGAYLLRRLNGGRNFGHSGPLRIVGGLMVSPRERIVVLEIENTWLVVGIVPGQIKTLHTLPKGEAVALPASEFPFAQWLKQMTERGHEKN